jgi:hypothetical protein
VTAQRSDKVDQGWAYLYYNAVIGASFDNLSLLTKWMEFDLVHSRKFEPCVGNLLEVSSAAEVGSYQYLTWIMMESSDPQVAYTHAPDRPFVSCFQEILPHRQSPPWTTVWIMDEKEVNISKFEGVAIVSREVLKGPRNRSRNRGVISRQDFGC